MKKNLLFYSIALITASTQAIHASLIIIENEEQFNKITQSSTPSVIIFSSPSCPSCRQLKDPLDRVVHNPEFSYITFAQADTTHNDALATKQRIRYLPTIQFIQNGQKKHEIIGSENAEQTISDAIRKTFGSAPTMTEKMKAAVAAGKESMHDTAQDIKKAAISAQEKTSEFIEDAKDKTSEFMDEAKEKTSEFIDEAKDKASEFMEETKQAMTPAETNNNTQSPIMSFFHAIVSAVTTAFHFVVDAFMNIVCVIKNLFSSK